MTVKVEKEYVIEFSRDQIRSLRSGRVVDVNKNDQLMIEDRVLSAYVKRVSSLLQKSIPEKAVEGIKGVVSIDVNSYFFDYSTNQLIIALDLEVEDKDEFEKSDFAQVMRYFEHKPIVVLFNEEEHHMYDYYSFVQ